MKNSFIGGRVYPCPEIFDGQTAFAYGSAFARLVKLRGVTCIAAARDTRRTSDMIASAFIAGALSGGVDVTDCGIACAAQLSHICMTKLYGGVLIGAPADTHELNGLKFFGKDGYILSDDDVRRIELAAEEPPGTGAFPQVGRLIRYDTSAEYAAALSAHLSSMGAGDLSGLSVAVDCADGSCCGIIPMIFNNANVKVFLLNSEADGFNINDGCGIGDTSALSAFVREKGCNAGFALSADGSRCICIDENGAPCDNDRLFAAALLFMKGKQLLADDAAVTTPLMNSALADIARRNDITIKTVGKHESHIAQAMKGGCNAAAIGGVGGAVFIGETGGQASSRTSDGILWMCMILGMMNTMGATVNELASVMQRYPQLRLTVRIREEQREVWKNIPQIGDMIEQSIASSEEAFKLTVREEREPLISVTAEGQDFEIVNRVAMDVAETLKRYLS